MSLSLDIFKKALPESKLREDSGWLFSPEPFALSSSQAKQIERLGHPLAKFQQASDLIYQRSMKGKLPSWIAERLNAGKPEWIIQQQLAPELREKFPQVIRPDLILTEDGFSLTELDSVPGGMGITAWLSQIYSENGFDVFGGASGITEGFQQILPNGGDILISEESSDYRPEMEWLKSQLNDVELKSVESLLTTAEGAKHHRDAYRFFEWFDWENIPNAKQLAARTNLSSPCKPHLEEKLWLALFWSPALQQLWQKEMRGSHLQKLKDVIPYGWLTDNTPLPPHACLPRLEVQTWQEVANFSQKQRELVLKISGFHELAWGSRGVVIGHDIPSDEWQASLDKALNDFNKQPWILQEFAHAKIVEHPYFDPETGETKVMKGRVRLCPYYFTDKSGTTSYAGTLATIAPADKKKIHGMKDAILVPCHIV